jgi:hypothetical protein
MNKEATAFILVLSLKEKIKSIKFDGTKKM